MAMWLWHEEDEFFYVHLNGIPDGQKVSETVDGEGFTIVTINFQSFQMDAGDTWLPADRSTKNLTTIGLCCNNASGAPTFGEIKIK